MTNPKKKLFFIVQYHGPFAQV